MKRRWNLRKIWIVLSMSNSPFSLFASDGLVWDCICGSSLYNSGKIKFSGYTPTLEQRLAKLEDAVFDRTTLREGGQK